MDWAASINGAAADAITLKPSKAAPTDAILNTFILDLHKQPVRPGPRLRLPVFER